MATSPEDLRRLYEPLSKHVKTLLNNDLKTICRSEGLPVTGVKAALQTRVLQRLDEAVTSGDAVRFQEVASKIRTQQPASYNATNASAGYSSPHNHTTHTTAMPNGHRTPGGNSYSAPQAGLMFTESPFFQIAGPPLTNVVQLPPMSTHRHTVKTSLTLSPDHVTSLRDNRAMRVMLYCASEDSFGSNSKLDVAFPSQIEIKINGDLFQGNLRGVKKKAGTTRPADLTSFVRKMPHYANDIAVTYAGTERRYSFLIHLVREFSVEELVRRIRHGNSITVQSVVSEMLSKAADPDIVTTSTVMSLKCPLSYARIELPCRSTVCNHNQCFDASSFLQVQQQAPQWTCPICNKTFSFENIVIDKYVEDILQKTSKATEQITIEPNGVWRSAEQESNKLQSPVSNKRKAEALDSDNDFFEVSGPSAAPHASHPYRTQQLPATSSSSQRETVGGDTSHKRSKRVAEEVIDLTLSSDEDDEPARPVKRQSLSTHGLYGSFNGSLHATPPTQMNSRPMPRLSFPMPSSQIPSGNVTRRPEDPRFYREWAG